MKGLPLQSISKHNADVAKLVDALDLGSSASGHGGSSPFIRTKRTLDQGMIEGFCLYKL